MKNLTKKALFLLLFTIPAFTGSVLADPPGPPGPGGDPGGSGGVPVGSPIDGTTLALLILASCYGVYKLIEHRKNRQFQKSGT